MLNLINFFNGKKTYILAFLGVVYAISGLVTGNLDLQQAIQTIQISLMGATIRHSIS